MSITTRAAIAVGRDEPLIIDEVELRAPGLGEVIVANKASGLCHSDLSILQGKLPQPLPCILGHEGAGVVEACGEGVTQVKPGDHVIVNNSIYCGECRACRTGRTSYCDQLSTVDASPFRWRGEPLRALGGAGSFAGHSLVQERKLTVLPDDMPFASAALVPCGVMTGTGAVWNDAKVEPGSFVVVFGMGSIGLNVVQGARVAGAARIIAVDTNPAKEAAARQFGATDFINPADGGEAFEKRVADLLGGPADHAFECVGHPALLAQALTVVSPFWGTTVAVGVSAHDQRIDIPASLFILGRTLRGTYMGNNNALRDTPKVVQRYKDGEIKIDELITHRLALEDINQGFDLMKAGKSIRSVVLF